MKNQCKYPKADTKNTFPITSQKKINKTPKIKLKFRKESWAYWTKCNDSSRNTTKFYLEKDKPMTNKNKLIQNWLKRGKNSHLSSTATPFQIKNSEKTFPTAKDNSKNSDNNLTT